MGYNKVIVIGFVFSVLFGCVVAQNQVGFGGSVVRETPAVIGTSVVRTHPATMAMRAFHLHVSYYDIVLFGEEGILSLSREVQSFIMADIISLLDQSVDKPLTLSSYLSATALLLDRSLGQLDQTSLRLDVFTQAMQVCLRDKDAADRLFFAAINDNDDLSAQNALQSSLLASSCATEYRVQANALKAQYDKLVFYTSILQKKYSYIDDKRTIILEYYPILRSDLLKELTLIASELQSFMLVK